MKEFDCVCVCEEKTRTSPIFPAKLGEPILLGFCTTTQLCHVIIYSGRRLNISLAILHLLGVEFSVFPYTVIMVGFYHSIYTRSDRMRC